MRKTKKKHPSDLFIPAGLFIGMGVGFLVDQLVAGLFIGMGIGFLAMALTKMMKK
jgi:hypothetical protein